MPSPDAPPAPRALSFVWPVQGALLVAAALYALFFHLTLPRRLPSSSDHAAVAEHLNAHAQPGDVVLLFPWWTDRARLHLPQSVPVVGYTGSDDDDLVRHPRIWVLAQPELPRADEAEFEEVFLPRRRPVGDPVRFGNLSLRLYENGRHLPVTFSAADAVAAGNAEVYLERADGRRTNCPRVGDGRYKCPGPPHLYVRTEWHEVLYEPRRCVYAHPPGGDSKLVIAFPPNDAEGALRLEAGIIWEHAVKRQGITPTQVRLETDGAALALELPPGREGFVTGIGIGSGADTASVSAGPLSNAPMRVTVQSQNAEARQVCLDLNVFATHRAGADAAGGNAR